MQDWTLGIQLGHRVGGIKLAYPEYRRTPADGFDSRRGVPFAMWNKEVSSAEESRNGSQESSAEAQAFNQMRGGFDSRTSSIANIGFVIKKKWVKLARKLYIYSGQSPL